MNPRILYKVRVQRVALPIIAEESLQQLSSVFLILLKITLEMTTILQNISSWYSLDSSHSDEYPYGRVSFIFQIFCVILYWANLPSAA